MEKVKLTKIFTTNKDKNGNELKTKDGRNYTRMSIKTEQHGDKWLSGFENGVNKNWKEGDEVEITIKQNGEYLNFDTPKKDDKVIEMLSELLTKVGTISAKLDVLYGDRKATPIIDPNYPTEEIDPQDIPF